jgi:two-component system, OmpR family, sensor histidine kinase CiaH
MKSSRRFGAWVTASRADPFTRARLRLTALYIAILAAVVLLLSSSFYAVHDRRVRDLGLREQARGESERGEMQRGSRPASLLLGEYLEILQGSIVLADIVAIAAAGALSYLLAGRTLRPIRDLMRSRHRFYADAAHDLRTPLAAMKAETEVALRDPERLSGDARRVLESSLEEIDRMSGMVEEMLLLSIHGSRGEGNLEGPAFAGEDCDIADLAATEVERMRSRAEAKGVKLAFEAAKPIILRLEWRSIARALANVVENAVKYTPAGGSVSVSLLASRARVEVVVADTGIGIRPADLPRVVDPFYRADAARASDGGGAGLGLAIVKRIMAEHGGSLEIASKEGEGTKVRLVFPADRFTFG